MKRYLFITLALMVFSWSIPKLYAQVNFTGPELVGNPTDQSIAINIIPDASIELYYEYGTSAGGPYTWQTSTYSATGGQAHEIVISGLNSNTRYYYRMQYRTSGGSWVARTEHSFQTQRAPGSTFKFTITSDSHASFNANHQNAMQNINNEQPDFHLDIGDTFYPDGTTSQSAVDTKYKAYRSTTYMGAISHSVPIFLASGNHEDEEGWNLDDTPFSIAVGSTQSRKMFYPTPIPDGFYTGNTDLLAAINEATYGDKYREDYYAWTWGDVLFVVIDEFQYTMNLPYAPGAAGEGNDDAQTGDQWSWTLGAQQFNWFKQTIQNSNAKYKFVFCHQMLGGIPNLTVSGVGPGYVRGGGGAAPYFEWGGKNADGSEGFASHRNPADFGTTPIHQLMVENGVSAYFHGHDHQYVYEKTDDGIVYQEVPSPSMSGSGFSGIYSTGDHGTFETIKMLASPGHLRITVTPTQATVDYISSTSTSGTVNYTYTILPNTPSVTYDLTVAVNPTGGGSTDPSVGGHTYAENTVVSVTATPASGYVFDHWSGDLTGSTNPTSITMDVNKSVTANFAAVPTYDLTMAVDPSGSGATTPAVGGHTYTENTVVNITATPASGYVFDHWSGDLTGSTNPTSITMTGTKSVTAHFTTIPTYDLTMAVDPSGGGTTNPLVGDHTYAENTVVNITATPASGYVFDHWSGNLSGSTNPTSITMNENKTVTAHFTAIPTYDLTMAVDPTGGGTTNPSVGDHTYAENTIVSITATPASGYVFDHWSGDLSGSTNPTSITMNGNKSVTAHFSETVPGALVLDGAVSSGTADATSSSISFTHTTGTGTNRLMLVGVSWNCGTTNRTISTITFTPNGGSALNLTEVKTQQYNWSTNNYRYTAIYRLLNPASGVTGTVNITFSGAVSNGIIAGAANFAGVDQTTPLGSPNGAVGTGTSSSGTPNPAVTLTGLNGNELVFDSVFMGASSTSHTMTADAGQSELWNILGYSSSTTSFNMRGAASTKQATGTSATMSWTTGGYGTTATRWAIAAVPIIPASSEPSMPSHTILLSRPTNNSVLVNAIMEQNGQLYIEYGTTSGNYSSGQTSPVAVTAGAPVNVPINGLAANTKYYYRLRFQATGETAWVFGDEFSFRTQRAASQTFTFTIASDSHLGQTFSSNTPARYEQTTLNIAEDNPDFHLDLGDAFIVSSDLGVGSNVTGNQAQVDAVYQAQRPYFSNFSHSASVFLAIGNHENEEGWNFDDTPFSRALASITARKQYFSNPIPGSFYSGNSDLLPAIGGDQLREDYFAWTWGDALFIVLDPFQYTMTKPYGTITGAGEDNDETVSGDQWNWTLGQQQYNWFKQTLENSNARYKFVFSHHVVGGQLNVSGAAGTPGYVRGGAIAAPYFEWGGNNSDDSWSFTTKRSGWGDDPIHQLMIANGVSAYFHGHDHQFVHELRDGIVYQLVPSAGMTGSGFDLYASSPYLVSGGNLPNAGHLRVTVSPDETTVEYVRSAVSGDTGVTNGQVSHTYTILPNVSTTYDLTMAVDPTGNGTTDPAVGVHTYGENAVVTITATPAAGYLFDHWSGDVANVNSASTTVTMNGNKTVTAHFVTAPAGILGDVNKDGAVNSTDALIILSGDVGIDVSQFCPMNCGDVNADGLVNSTDALIILSFDVGMSMPFPVGQPGCPGSITPPAGCNP